MNKQNNANNKQKTSAKRKNNTNRKRPYVASDDYFEFGEYLDLSSKDINKNVIDSFFKSHSLKSKKINQSRSKDK